MGQLIAEERPSARTGQTRGLSSSALPETPKRSLRAGMRFVLEIPQYVGRLPALGESGAPGLIPPLGFRKSAFNGDGQVTIR